MLTFDPLSIRRSTSLNQAEFWSVLGVTQSAGSRYERGFPMPEPTRILFRLAYIEGISIATLRHEDAELGLFLRESMPSLYEELVRRVFGLGIRHSHL